MKSAYLLYNDSGLETGSKIGDMLEIKHGSKPTEVYDYLIRWGDVSNVKYQPRMRELNKKVVLDNIIDKYRALEIMSSVGIPTPAFSKDWKELQLPILGRRFKHTQGEGIRLILQEEDIKHSKSDFYTEYIPKKKEYRVHVFEGDVIIITEKIPRRRYRYDSICWNNYSHRYVDRRLDLFKRNILFDCIKAVVKLGLDFGAVDIIISKHDVPYILEVNTCPALNHEHRKIYANKFKEILEFEHEEKDEDREASFFRRLIRRINRL